MASGLRTTVVGSWWPLVEFDAALQRYHRGELSQAVAEQRALGLTEWTGGEYYAFQFVEHLQRIVTGLHIEVPTKAEVFDYDDLAVARIDGVMTARQGLGYLEAYLREKDLPGGVSKATVVGPVEVAINVMHDFESLRPQLPNLVRIINQEIRGLAEAGCPHIQLDVPTSAALITNGLMSVAETAQMIAGCFEGVQGCRRGVHICSGNLRGRPLSGDLSSAPWADVLVQLGGVVDVALLALHYFNRFLERNVFKQLPRNMELAAGIVDEASYWVEPVSKIRERARAWAAVVGEERLWLAPSCGFGRHPMRNIPVLRQKIANMVEAAATL
jgi:5-methyltetrahydropteroyltriglutamate--homocysteine methyltransferase